MNFSGKILLVDDEPHIRKFVGIILKKCGEPTVVEASNGAEALQLIAADPPDLILLDVNMPVLDGVQTLDAIMKNDPEAVVVMLTSLVNRHTVEECLRLGAAGYIRKDTPSMDIRNELERILTDCFGAEDAVLPTQ